MKNERYLVFVMCEFSKVLHAFKGKIVLSKTRYFESCLIMLDFFHFHVEKHQSHLQSTTLFFDFIFSAKYVDTKLKAGNKVCVIWCFF